MQRLVILLLLPLLLLGCVRSKGLAPVENGWQHPSADGGLYKVHRGDTIYSIAWQFGLDYRALAEANKLKPPYRIRAGQNLRMSTVPRPPGKTAQTFAKGWKGWLKAGRSALYLSQWSKKNKIAGPLLFRWVWPAQGRIIARYSEAALGNKGVDIGGRLGESVVAAAPGVVVYIGAGVRGYGNLIIIKHNSSYLSAYAFNKRILVKEGSRVQRGQRIAEMGRNNAGRTLLHFEIRRDGKPVNPLRYLPVR